MSEIFIIATSVVTQADVASARLGTRFGRMDLLSQLALLAVEPLAVHFGGVLPDRIAICLSASAGSLSTDVDFWDGRHSPGGPSPMLFAYTLPSAAIGEIAIRHKLTGPNLCFVGDDRDVLHEAEALILRAEADAVVCISCEVVSKAAAGVIGMSQAAQACALLLQKDSKTGRALKEFGRDMKSLCANFSAT